MKEENIESIMGIPVFKWSSWDEIDIGWLQFYEVEFILPELLKFNTDGVVATLKIDGTLEIFDDVGKSLFKSFLSDINSFKKGLCS